MARSGELRFGPIGGMLLGVTMVPADSTAAPLGMPDDRLASKLADLEGRLRSYGSVVIAFSGGADSAFLAHTARRVLGREAAHCITAISASLASDEEIDCRRLAEEWDLRWTPIATDELASAAYAMNDRDRCYHCKTELMHVVEPIAVLAEAMVLLGVNVDDMGDHRPGQRAASERGAAFPLLDAGMTKTDIRALSRLAGLRTWDKPAAACLASRLPYGAPVTLRVLTQVDKAEASLHRLGFRQLRVRHYEDTARIEVDVDAIADVVARRDEVVAAVKQAGYRYVTVDLEGFRSGNLN